MKELRIKRTTSNDDKEVDKLFLLATRNHDDDSFVSYLLLLIN